MQRMNITLDMESNEVLSKEIEKIIEGAVKEKTRDFFNDGVEKEIERITKARFENLMKKGGYYNNESVLEKKVKELIDNRIQRELGKIEISSQDIRNRIDEKLENIAETVDYAVRKRVESLDIKGYIKEETAGVVRSFYPKEIIKLAQEKEMENLLQRIKELEAENERLRNGGTNEGN